MTTTLRKPTETIVPGDVILFSGAPHLVTSTTDRNGFGWPIARAADGWSIVLEPGQRLDVAGVAS